MSNVNVRRAVENIRSGTNVYTPLVETVVNAIQAISAGAAEKGRIDIVVKRSNQKELEGGQPPVESFTVIDNGIGFNTSAVSIKNTGIGLNQIEARLEMMNGKLSINSVKDKGTRISITISGLE